MADDPPRMGPQGAGSTAAHLRWDRHCRRPVLPHRCRWGGRARVSVVAAGERWGDAPLRPVVEDGIGAGALSCALRGIRSPKAASAAATFQDARGDLANVLRHSPCGKALLERGFGDEVECAAARNGSHRAAILRERCHCAGHARYTAVQQDAKKSSIRPRILILWADRHR